MFFMLFISFQFIKFTSDTKYEFTQPSFFATSTSLCELEEFSDPTISITSTFEAIFLTAICLFVVA